LESLAEWLPERWCADFRDDGNNAQLLPQLVKGAQNRGLRHFAAQRIANLRSGHVGGIELLGGKNGELGNLARPGQLGRTAPVAISSQSVDIGKNPSSDDVIRLISGLTGKVEANGHTFGLQPDQKGLGCTDQFESGFGRSLACYGLYKGRSGGRSRQYRLACLRGTRQENTKSGLLDPGTDILNGDCPVSVLAHPFGARCFQLLCCQR
jgi:hypothetical protein